MFGSGSTHLSSAFILGKDFNGNTREEIFVRYEAITGHQPKLYQPDRLLEFERAIEKGGLQGQFGIMIRLGRCWLSLTLFWALRSLGMGQH